MKWPLLAALRPVSGGFSFSPRRQKHILYQSKSQKSVN